MDDLNMIWNEVVRILSLEVNNIQIQNWILPLTPVSLDDTTLVLDAKTRFIRTMVEKQYVESIRLYTEYLIRRPIQVRLIDPEEDSYRSISAGARPAERPAPPVFEQKSAPQAAEPARFPAYAPETARVEPERFSPEPYAPAGNGRETLNPKYTMNSFVTGPSNEFAVAAARAVVKNPGTTYNPFFIYGGSGLGKTHLMQAIALEILDADPTKNVYYITSEKFMNEMIAMIENGSNAEKERFRKKYRSIDVLLIDDIQFIAGKKATMEEIFHTFNDLKEENKQIILSSDKPPRELTNLEERLVTRFEGGMTADIQPPDFETRVAILNHKMRGQAINLPPYVLECIASNVSTSIRELEGALLKVIAFFIYKKVNATGISKNEALDITREALKLYEKKELTISVADIMNFVTRKYDLEKGDLISDSRKNSIAQPRQIAMYLAKKMTTLSYVAIGKAFKRDHSTVIYAVDKIEEKCGSNPSFKEELKGVMEQLKNNG